MHRFLLRTMWLLSLLAEIVAWPAFVVGPYIVAFYAAANFTLGCVSYCLEGEWTHQDGAISLLFGTFAVTGIILWVVRNIRQAIGDALRSEVEAHY
jgi:hypothetical protein